MIKINFQLKKCFKINFREGKLFDFYCTFVCTSIKRRGFYCLYTKTGMQNRTKLWIFYMKKFILRGCIKLVGPGGFARKNIG